MATFVNKEWATGNEDPLLFNPTQLDCNQWADAAISAGMKYGILTVKHTEGYPLWNSAYTTHDIGSFLNYKNGQGDIVQEFSDAFRNKGLKVGFYYCFPGDYGGTNPNLMGMPPEAQGNYVNFINNRFED